MTEEFEVKIGRVSLKGFTTAELVAELKTRHELCPVVDEMTREPVCLCVMTTESLVAELSKRDGAFIEDLINPAEIYPWYVIKHEFKEYHRVPAPAKILVVRE